jgi:hypothetical protein
MPRRTFSIVAKCRPAAFTRSGERTQEEETCRRGAAVRRILQALVSSPPDAFKLRPVIMADVRSLRVPVVCRMALTPSCCLSLSLSLPPQLKHGNHWCDICKCFVSRHAAAIRMHEQSDGHKGKLADSTSLTTGSVTPAVSLTR